MQIADNNQDEHTLALRHKEANSLFEALEGAKQANDIDLMYLIDEKIRKIWEIDCKKWNQSYPITNEKAREIEEIYHWTNVIVSAFESGNRFLGRSGLTRSNGEVKK